MEDFPSTISGIIRDCLQFDPKKRPNANDIAERLVKTQFEKLPRHENGNLDLQQCVIDDSTYRVSSLLREDYPHMINKVDFNGNTLLMVAKSEEIRRSILSHRRIPNCNTEPSRIPEYFHNTDVLGSLLRLAKKGDVEAVKSLGRLGLRDLWDEHYEHVAAYKGKNPLHVSAQTGDVAILDAVINLRIFDASKANDDGHTPLHVASIHGHAGVIERLLHLEKGSKTNRGAGTVGTQTAPARSFVNAQDRMGKSALHLAARNGNLYATKALLRNSSTNINIPDTNFQTPIFDSIPEAGSGRAVQIAILEAFLSEPGVSVNEVDSTGETVLHKVARGGFCKSARLLIQRKDLSLSSKERENGDTPLLLATRELSVGVVEALLTREDISINEVDKFGNTPLHILATHFVFSEAMPAAQLALQHKQRRIELSQSDVSINQTGRVRDGGLLYRAAPRDNVGVSNEAPLRLEFDAHATAEDTVDTYVKEEARFNARIKIERLTSLHNAAFEVANLLLSGAGQDVNARDKVLRTPLHMAVSGGNAKFTEFLLSRHDVEADARDKYQRTPLHFAATSGGDEVANMLLSRNDVEADARDESRQTPLHLAARSGDVEVAKVLLSRNDVEADAREESRQTPLHLAAFSGVVEVAKVLIARSDVDINALDEHHKTPLYYAAAMNRVEVTEIFLLQDNIMVNAQDHDQETPLHIATYYSKNELEIVTLFLSRPDVQINPQGYDLRTPLHIAAEKNYFEVAKLFLSRRDVDAEVRDKHGETPLHYAARRESVEVAKLLLSRDDVDVNALNDKRQTLLYLAALGGSVGVTKLLLSRDDVDNNAWDVNGRTPLHIAADKGNNEVAKLLLSSPDVDATARDNRQETPLHRAAAENRVEVANLFLLRDDVDTNAHDVNGKTALDLAEANDAAECVALLLGKEDAESASE